MRLGIHLPQFREAVPGEVWALAGGHSASEALVAGHGRAFLVGAGIAVAASLSALPIPGAPRARAEAAPPPRHPRADMSMWMNDHWCPSRSRNPRMYMNS
jgi:hypothetical protein